jgi:hypothetical protein
MNGPDLGGGGTITAAAAAAATNIDIGTLSDNSPLYPHFTVQYHSVIYLQGCQHKFDIMICIFYERSVQLMPNK